MAASTDYIKFNDDKKNPGEAAVSTISDSAPSTPDKPYKNGERVHFLGARVLYELSSGDLNNESIAERVGIEPSYVGLLLSGLKKKGFHAKNEKIRKVTPEGIAELETLEELYGAALHNYKADGFQIPDIEIKNRSNDSLVVNRLDASDLLNSIGAPDTDKKHNPEILKYEVLVQINRGVLKNEVIARNVGDISTHDVSVIVGMLRKDGCVEGYQSKRRITSIGIERLNPHQEEDEQVIETPEMKSSPETEPVNQDEELHPFPSLSYRGLAGKKPSDETRNKAFGENQVTRYINKRWYADRPISEGPYATAKKEPKPVAKEAADTGTLIEEPHEVVPEIHETETLVSVLDVMEDSEPIEYDEKDLQILKLLLGIEKGLDAKELSDLFADKGGLYLVESGIRREGYFLKGNGIYKLAGTGTRKLESLKEECSGIIPEYACIIDYLHEHKEMPPLKEPEKEEMAEELIVEEVKTDPLIVPEPVQTPVSTEQKGTDGAAKELLEEAPAVDNKHVSVVLTEKEPEEIELIAPSQSFLTITEETIEELAKSVGLLKKGPRYIILSNENPRTLVAGGRFQQIGKQYLAILQEGSNGYDASLYADMKILEWISGDKKITRKGVNAELLLEWLTEYYQGI